MNIPAPSNMSGCCTHYLLFQTGPQRRGSTHPPAGSPPSPWTLPWVKEKIKTNRTLISGPCFSLLSCWQKEPSPGRLPQIKASCLPLAASPICITTTKPAETIIYSFWCGFWSYPTSSTMPPTILPPSLLLSLAQPLQLSVSFTPKETRSCQLLCKVGCFEGAAVPAAFSLLYCTPLKVYHLEEKLMGRFI